MKIIQEVKELTDNKIISPEVAEKILDYYREKEKTSPNRLYILFSIIGALLVGLGIILIIAHNWDLMSRGMKTILSFVPMLLGQTICVYVYFRKKELVSWREGASTLLFFAVGACIALISQTYHVGGELSTYLLTWMLLCIPLVYIFSSSVVSLLYLIGISFYALNYRFDGYINHGYNWYWLLILGVGYHYYLLTRDSPHSNFTRFHHWLVPLSILVGFNTISDSYRISIHLAYFCLLGLFIQLGNSRILNFQNTNYPSYKVIGILGTIGLLFALSFEWFWEELRTTYQTTHVIFRSEDLVVILLPALIALVLLAYNQKNTAIKEFKFYSIIFLVLIPIYLIGIWYPIAQWLINILTFALGIALIKDGVAKNKIAKLNIGLLTIMALIAFRFLDSDLSFVLRGVLFLLLGIGFFTMNYWMLKREKR